MRTATLAIRGTVAAASLYVSREPNSKLGP